MKESFLLYNSFYEPIKYLSDEQLGRLLRAIFNYSSTGEITEDKEIMIAFMFIKNQIDLDTKKYEDIKKKRSEAGKKHKGNQYTKWNKMEQMNQNGTNGSDNDNVNDNDNDNVNKKKKEIYKEKRKYGEFENVLLTEEEYHKLDKSNLLSYIDTLSNYIASKGKKYKSHYSTILNWANKDNKEKNKNNSETKLISEGNGVFHF